MKLLRTRELWLALALLGININASAQTGAVAGAQVWQVTRFDIAATLPAANATERAFTARATLSARNVSPGEGRTFTVRLNPAAEVTAVTVGDAPATFVKRADDRTKTQTDQITLPAPVPAGASVTVAIDYRLALTGQNTGLAAISPEGAQFLPLSFWYPTPNSPFAAWGADYAPVRLTVTARSGETVVASGAASGATFDQKLAGQPFFLTGKWETVEGTGEARGISAFPTSGASADERRQAEAFIALAAAARSYYGSLLGPAPDAPVRLVAARRGVGFDMGGTALLEAAAFRRAKVDAVSAMAISETVARLWLGGATPVRGAGAGVVREGLVRYLATLFIEKQFGRDAAEAERQRQRTAYTAIARRDAPLALTTPFDATYLTSVANKGAMVWRLAERASGRDGFISLLRAQLQTGELSLNGLRAPLNERGGAPLKALLDVQLDQPTETDLQIGLPQQRGGEWVSALRNTGAQNVTVTVTATTDTGQPLTTEVTLPAQDFGEAHFKTTAKLVRVEVDPDKIYPQLDYANDIAPRGPWADGGLEEATRAFGGGDYARAETVARTMLQTTPLMQEARIFLARALLEQNKLADAEREFRLALDDKLPTPATLAWSAFGLGEIAQRKGQAAEALQRYTEAVRAEGGYAPTLAARTARLKAEAAPGTTAGAADEAAKQFISQLDLAIRGGRKTEIEALVVPGELLDFTKGFIKIQPELWQTRLLRTEPTGGERIAADVAITAKAEGRDKTITAVYILARTGGGLRLAEIPIFEER